MNAWIEWPLELRMVVVAALGSIGGAVANHMIYTFAFFNPQPISPWATAAPAAPPRSWVHRIPVVGWLGRRGESALHGRGFWIRPLLIEAFSAVLFLAMYGYETQAGGLLPAGLRFPRFLSAFEPTATIIFSAHAVLAVLMIAATFIDFDELTIPDAITIPGTLMALLFAAATLNHFPPTALPPAEVPPTAVAPTTFDAPWFDAEPATQLNRWLSPRGLALALLIWSGWCFALADRRWSAVMARRRGLARALRHFANGLFHYGFWKVLASMWILGLIGITGVWYWGGDPQRGLFTALVGLAVGGGTIWAIRVVATLALDKEAMGFGDVTLMAMIGAFIGWQGALIAFFLSPFTAILIVLARYVVTRDVYTPYGPYLCAGSALTICYWDGLYNRWLAPNLTLMGNLLLWLCLALLALMAGMLFVWRLIKDSWT